MPWKLKPFAEVKKRKKRRRTRKEKEKKKRKRKIKKLPFVMAAELLKELCYL